MTSLSAGSFQGALRRRVLPALVCVGLLAATALAESPRIEDYAADPEISLADLSPTGDRITFRRNRPGGDQVSMVDLATMETRHEAEVDLGTIYKLSMLDNGSILAFASEAQRDFRRRAVFRASAVYHLDGDSGTVERLLEDVRGVDGRRSGTDRVVGVSPDGQSIFMLAVYRNRIPGWRKLGLFEVDLATHQSRLIAPGTPSTVDWFVNGVGRVVAREDFDDRANEHTIWAVDAQGEAVLRFRKETAFPTLTVAGLTRDEKSLVIVSADATSDGTDLFLLDLENGAVRAAGLGRPNSTIDEVIMDLNRRVAGVSFAGLRPGYGFFDKNLEARVAGVQDRFADTAVRLADWSDDFQTLLFHVSGSYSSGAFLFANAQSGLQWVGQERPNITAPAKVSIVRYPARDGLEISALLTLPPRADASGRLPLVVLPHGGPRDNDTIGFDPMAQYLAHRGIVVLQPQFRGSTGQGIEFEEKGLGQWGRAMSTDLDDGVQYLAGEGFIDPQRVCMVGTSYGGYAALAAGAFSRLPYRCLVSIAGISDLGELLRNERQQRGRRSWSVDLLERQLGVEDGDRHHLKARSPVEFAANFGAPVLLLHGTDDTVVPPRHSQDMARALERAGKPVELRLMPGVDHWFTQTTARLEMMERIDRFLGEHLF